MLLIIFAWILVNFGTVFWFYIISKMTWREVLIRTFINNIVYIIIMIVKWK